MCLFLALGPLALPLLLKSREFSKTEKIAYSAIVVFVTALFIALIAYITIIILRRYSMYNDLLNEMK